MVCNPYRLFGVAPATTVGARITGLVERASALAGCKEVCGLVRVAGTLISQVRDGANLTPQMLESDSQISAAPFAKLEISTSDALGRVIIDADSQIVLPGRSVCGVRVLAPATWTDPSGAASNLAASGLVWDVRGSIQVAKVDDGADVLGRLTEFVTLAALAQTTFVRPRGARRVQFFSLAVPQFWELWAGVPAIGQLVGLIQVPANSLDPLEMMPGVTHIRNVPFAGQEQIGLVWEVAAL